MKEAYGVNLEVRSYTTFVYLQCIFERYLVYVFFTFNNFINIDTIHP